MTEGEQETNIEKVDALVNAARRLAKSDVAIPSLEWEKEAHRVKYAARRAYSERSISHEQMTKIIKMLEEAEE